MALLQLEGTRGKMCIVPVYLDPRSITEQLKNISNIESCVREDADIIVAGDFNLVTRKGDCIANKSGETRMSSDKRHARKWMQMARARKLHEYEQNRYTCENSHGWSRIDRVYTSMH